MSIKFPMTIRGQRMIQDELDNLIKVDREAIKVAIAEARALGDLKENAEYHAAKEKQSHIEGRISELQAKLANAQVINVSSLSGDKVVFGATVSIFNLETEKSQTFQIVGQEEAISSKGKMSFDSPIAKSLIGKEEGDEVTVKAPKGDILYEIENVEFI